MNINRQRIETILAERGMTKAVLASNCGISRQNISTIIRRGTCEPRTAGKLAEGLGVPVADITEDMTPMKAIRAKCLDCCGGQTKEIRLCPVKKCPLYPYRFGKRPQMANYTGEVTEGEKTLDSPRIFAKQSG